MTTRILRSPRAISLSVTLAIAASGVSCTDPVRDQQIDALGPEDPAVPQGPEHRPGQPCVLCHSAGGPASKAFAVAGTIFEKRTGEKGAEGVAVYFVDSQGGRRIADTNAVGNFFITESEWKDISFPFRVAIQKGKADPQTMSTPVNREPSCNFCHKGAGSYDAIPQVYVSP